MTVFDIANRLNDCANGKCDGCKYREYEDVFICQGYLIKDMGAEAEKVAEQMQDDGK